MTNDQTQAGRLRQLKKSIASFVPTDDSRARMLKGRIKGRDGEGRFYIQSEEAAINKPLAELIHRQPPLFHPREDWSHWDPAKPLKLELGAQFQDISNALANVQPRKCYRVERYNGCSWLSHCQDVLAFLEELYNNRLASNFSLHSALSMLTYGLDDWLAVSRGEIKIMNDQKTTTVTGSTKENKDGTDQSFPAGYFVPGDGAVLFPPSDPLKIRRQAMAGKRFYAGLCLFEQPETPLCNHWISYIWDKLKGHLIVYDTLQTDRQARVKALAVAWRVIMTQIGFPYSFDVVSPAVTMQPGGQECGFLALMMLMLNLRGLVGATYNEIDCLGVETLQWDNKPHTRVSGLPDLLHRNWLLLPSNAANAERLGVKMVYKFLKVMAADELGLKDMMIMKSGTRVGLLKGNTDEYKPWNGKLSMQRAALCFTNLGGYSCFIPNNLSIHFQSTNRVIAPGNIPVDQLLHPWGPIEPTNLDKNLDREPSTKETNPRSDSKAKSESAASGERTGVLKRKEGPMIEALPIISSVSARCIEGKEIDRGLEQYPKRWYKLGKAGREMTFDITDETELPRLDLREFYTLPSVTDGEKKQKKNVPKTYVTYIPEGLMASRYWDQLFRSGAVLLPPRLVEGSSRSQRAAMRAQQKRLKERQDQGKASETGEETSPTTGESQKQDEEGKPSGTGEETNKESEKQGKKGKPSETGEEISPTVGESKKRKRDLWGTGEEITKESEKQDKEGKPSETGEEISPTVGESKKRKRDLWGTGEEITKESEKQDKEGKPSETGEENNPTTKESEEQGKKGKPSETKNKTSPMTG